MPTVAAAVDLLVSLLQASQTVSELIQSANATGRTTLTTDEWAQLQGEASTAHAKLEALLNG